MCTRFLFDLQRVENDYCVANNDPVLNCYTALTWWHQYCQWNMRHGLQSVGIALFWLAGLNIDWGILGWREYGDSHSFPKPLAVPLYSLNGRQMPAVKAVQGDCEKVYLQVTCRVPPCRAELVWDDIKNMLTFPRISRPWDGTGSWNPFSEDRDSYVLLSQLHHGNKSWHQQLW